MNFFLIHGAYGHSEENWFPWLKNKLEKLGHTVYVPKFPTPKGQTLENWMKVFDEYIHLVDENTVFIGHSLGPAFILSVLEKIDKPVKACFFASPALGTLGNPTFGSINESFVRKEFDWIKIKKNCEKFYAYIGDNDPYIPLKNAKLMTDKLDSELVLIENGGHLNESAGFTKFEKLFDDVVEITKLSIG